VQEGRKEVMGVSESVCLQECENHERCAWDPWQRTRWTQGRKCPESLRPSRCRCCSQGARSSLLPPGGRRRRLGKLSPDLLRRWHPSTATPCTATPEVASPSFLATNPTSPPDSHVHLHHHVHVGEEALTSWMQYDSFPYGKIICHMSWELTYQNSKLLAFLAMSILWTSKGSQQQRVEIMGVAARWWEWVMWYCNNVKFKPHEVRAIVLYLRFRRRSRPWWRWRRQRPKQLPTDPLCYQRCSDLSPLPWELKAPRTRRATSPQIPPPWRGTETSAGSPSCLAGELVLAAHNPPVIPPPYSAPRSAASCSP